MAVPIGLLNKIREYEVAGETPDRIIAGMAQSTTYLDIAKKVQEYQKVGETPDRILAGIKSSPITKSVFMEPAMGRGVQLPQKTPDELLRGTGVFGEEPTEPPIEALATTTPQMQPEGTRIGPSGQELKEGIPKVGKAVAGTIMGTAALVPKIVGGISEIPEAIRSGMEERLPEGGFKKGLQIAAIPTKAASVLGWPARKLGEGIESITPKAIREESQLAQQLNPISMIGPVIQEASALAGDLVQEKTGSREAGAIAEGVVQILPFLFAPKGTIKSMTKLGAAPVALPLGLMAKGVGEVAKAAGKTVYETSFPKGQGFRQIPKAERAPISEFLMEEGVYPGEKGIAKLQGMKVGTDFQKQLYETPIAIDRGYGNSRLGQGGVSPARQVRSLEIAYDTWGLDKTPLEQLKKNITETKPIEVKGILDKTGKPAIKNVPKLTPEEIQTKLIELDKVQMEAGAAKAATIIKEFREGLKSSEVQSNFDKVYQAIEERGIKFEDLIANKVTEVGQAVVVRFLTRIMAGGGLGFTAGGPIGAVIGYLVQPAVAKILKWAQKSVQPRAGVMAYKTGAGLTKVGEAMAPGLSEAIGTTAKNVLKSERGEVDLGGLAQLRKVRNPEQEMQDILSRDIGGQTKFITEENLGKSTEYGTPIKGHMGITKEDTTALDKEAKSWLKRHATPEDLEAIAKFNESQKRLGGRKPIGEKPMTPAERQRKHRAKPK